MPTVVRIGRYRVELHTGRERPPPHVHVVCDGRDVTINLVTLAPFGIESFRVPRNVRAWIEDNQTQLLRRWDEYHR